MKTELGYINTVVLMSPVLKSTAAVCYLISIAMSCRLVLKKEYIANSVVLYIRNIYVLHVEVFCKIIFQQSGKIVCFS